MKRYLVLTVFLLSACSSATMAAESDVGIVLMHGKQGSPINISGLARTLRSAGFIVSTPEMPWSQRRELDVPYEQALADVESEANSLERHGAKVIVIGGRSLGANGAIAYAASGRRVNAIFALGPGHVPEREGFRRVVALGVEQARDMIAKDNADEKAWFPDINQGSSRQIRTTARSYLSYFDPDGMASMPKSAAAITTAIPIFMAIGNADVISNYAEKAIFSVAPKHELSRYVALEGDHMNIDRIAAPQLIAWLKSLAP
jgi:esterase/lipase